MTAPKPFARPKTELSYRPVEINKSSRKSPREERRKAVQNRKPEGMKDTLIEAAEAANSGVENTPAQREKQPFVLQPHLTHRPFAGLKHKLK